MKRILLILIIALVSPFIFSQNCESFSPYKQGMILEYTNYNKKGKEKSIERHHIKSVTNSGGNLVIEIESSEVSKKKNTPINLYTLKCENGNFLVDMSNYTSHRAGDNDNESFNVKATGDFLEFPTDMNPNSQLKDGNIDIELGSSESSLAIANMEVNNRKVLENGTLITKAGAFEGYKISFDYLFNMGFIKIRGSGIEWYVDGIGIVRTESYSKKGKLRWTRELTKIENN